MKTINKIIMCCFLSLSIFTIKISAHSIELNIDYDECIASTNNDGIDEIWYYLYKMTNQNKLTYRHIDEEVETISYFFEEKNMLGYEWTTDISEEEAKNIKDAYAESMKKWNDVYYYSYDSFGNQIKNKVINIVEGTSDNHNISIMPARENSEVAGAEVKYAAVTHPDGITETIDTINKLYNHEHNNGWLMIVNIQKFSYNGNNEFSVIDNRENTGCHEMGHVLGLKDIDLLCDAEAPDHHSELIMGYEQSSNYIHDISYKDIAGVSITRAFHTDDDHIWMKRINEDDTIDLICAQCNGVLYNAEIDLISNTYNGKPLNVYKDCVHYDHENSNMLLVAQYSNKYFYKCQYCRYIKKIELNGTVDLNNYSLTFTENINLNKKEVKYYKINICYNKFYQFEAKSKYGIEMRLYDENFNELNIEDLNSSFSEEHFIDQLAIGTYYLEITNIASLDSNVFVKINSRTTSYITVGENDILLNTHNYNEGVYLSNHYCFPITGNAGLYQFSLIGITIDGELIQLPQSAITIYTDENLTNVLNKVSSTIYSDLSTNKQNENSFVSYLAANSYYYIDINIQTHNLTSLHLNINLFETENIDLFDISDCSNTTFEVLDNDHLGDYFQMIDLKQAGSFYMNVQYNGELTEDFIYILARRRYIVDINKFVLETITYKYIDIENNNIWETLNLEDGIYYIGFINKQDNADFKVSFTRRITDYGSEHLITDPEDMSLCGSQIKILEMNNNNKSYYSNIITVGFTRLIYLDETDFDDLSRLEYYWYSSNESIAKVTNYGTVLGVSPGVVKIMAVHKDDCSIVYVKEFEIIEDTSSSSDIIEVTSNYYVKYSETDNGSFHLQLEKTNCPYPMYQYYDWGRFIYNESVGLETTVLGNCNFHVTGLGSFTIIGTYTINPRIKVIINIVVLE